MMVAMVAYIMIELHGPAGQHFEVNPHAIVGLRSPKESEHFGGKDIKCIVNTNDGKFFAVIEDCETVRRMIEGED